MEKQLIIFTRTSKVDYGLLVSPSEEFCPSSIRKIFREKIRGLINVDEYNPDLSTPRWIFCRLGDFVLWGVGCWNETHGSDCIVDEVGRKKLRNFVGVVYKGSVSKLPYDISYFSNEFNTNISPLWKLSKQDIQVKEGIEADNYEGNMYIIPSVSPGLNKIDKICVTHHVENAERLFSAALISDTEVTVVSNIRDVELAFDERYRFMNACIIGEDGGRTHHYSEAEHNIGKKAENTKEEIRPKKDYRPMIIAIVAFLIILLTIALFTGRNKNSSLSPSGEKGMKKEKKIKEIKKISFNPIAEVILKKPKKK